MTTPLRGPVAALVLLASLAGCASVPPPSTSSCGADRASAYVGREATPEVRNEVAAAVGPRPIRWIGPDDAVTMDFSEARLNMMLDGGGTVTGVRCG